MPTFYSQSGQWLADTISVAHTSYDYGKKQSVSSSIDSARIRQTRAQRSRERNLQCRDYSGLYQKITKPACFGGIEPHSAGLRSPCAGLIAPQTPH